jgi:opacity protein-like surface antigen
MRRMICAAMFVAATPAAFAQTGSGETGSYWSLGAGLTGESEFDYDFPGGNVEADTNAGFGISAAYGIHVSPNLRTEFGLSWSKAEIDIVRRFGGPQILVYEEPGDIVSYMLDANVYWDFATSGLLRPYVGAGIGLGMIDVNDRVIAESAFGWKWQAIAGVDIPMSNGSSVFVEGRYEALTREIGDGLGFADASDDFNSETIGVFAGMRFGM